MTEGGLCGGGMVEQGRGGRGGDGKAGNGRGGGFTSGLLVVWIPIGPIVRDSLGFQGVYFK